LVLVLARSRPCRLSSLFQPWRSCWFLQKIAICSPSCILHIPHSAFRTGRMSAWFRHISIVSFCMSCNLDRNTRSVTCTSESHFAGMLSAITRKTTYRYDSCFAWASPHHHSERSQRRSRNHSSLTTWQKWCFGALVSLCSLLGRAVGC
jgi:hypothetical protein